MQMPVEPKATGRKIAPRCRVARLFRLCLALAILTPAIARDRSDAAADRSGAGALATCDIITTGPLTYRMDLGAWIRHASGARLATLPLELKTQATPCRLILDACNILEIAPESVLTIKSDPARAATYKVALECGALIYALTPAAQIEFNLPPGDVRAASIPEPLADVPTSVAGMGFIRVVPNGKPSVEISAVKGRLRVNRSEAEALDLAAGQWLSFSQTDGHLIYSYPDHPATPVGASTPGGTARKTGGTPWWQASATGSGSDSLESLLGSGRAPSGINIPEVHTRMSPWAPPPRPRGTTQPPSSGASTDSAPIRAR